MQTVKKANLLEVRKIESKATHAKKNLPKIIKAAFWIPNALAPVNRLTFGMKVNKNFGRDVVPDIDYTLERNLSA